MSWFYILTTLAKATRRNAKKFFMKECNQLEAYVLLFPNTKIRCPFAAQLYLQVRTGRANEA